MKKHPLTAEIIALMRKQADPSLKEGMEKYMRDQFPFLGLKSPLRKEILKEVTRPFRELSEKEWPQVAEELWDMPERECQYMAMELFALRKKQLHEGHLPLLEKMIAEKSWWDTVDFLAANIAGPLFRNEPQLIAGTIRKWTAASEFWFHRSAILFQLKYGRQTDEELLFRLCKKYAGEKEFFMRKAIGWALRQYSKTNPDAVRKFINSNSLSPLSLKEAGKYL